ncbi:hypothetical protein N7471_010281 [Penicillium samsonianum]|uniref:uncharacterized protein n=1 Tax=Penicillium samsonianum TaxID=1882272 RepID=UPI0025469F1F|nr:uncharacterized protein N7471_010281 [Penicillium samsonianum]KAJ6125788.1 hypothetical protein N7471_010281 [Penicillium samsonianum]
MTVLAQYSSESPKVVEYTCSIPSTPVGTPQKDQLPEQLCRDPDGDNEHMHDNISLRGDKEPVCCCKLGLCDKKYAKLKGLNVFPPHREENTPDQKQWMLNISQLVAGGPADIAIELAKESYRKFHEVPNKEFVR